MEPVWWRTMRIYSFLCNVWRCTAQPRNQTILRLLHRCHMTWKTHQRYSFSQFAPWKQAWAEHIIKSIVMRRVWSPLNVKTNRKPQKKTQPTRGVFQKEPDDTLRWWRFKGTRSEGDLVRLPQISWPTFSRPGSDGSFCSLPHQGDFFITASLFPAPPPPFYLFFFFLNQQWCCFSYFSNYACANGPQMKLDRFNELTFLSS